MTHHAAADFWTCYHLLPTEIQKLATRAYDLLKENPRHPSLHFKKADAFWSVRVGLHHRALGMDVDDGVLWFWIGTHADYDKLLA